MTTEPGLNEFAWASKNGHYFTLAATTVVIWDHITTIDVEIELIWRKKASLVQLFYFLVRYSGDALFLHATAVQLLIPEDAFLKTCSSFTRVQVVLGGMVLMSTQAIMVHRIISMYKNQENVSKYLGFFLITMICASMVIAFFALFEIVSHTFFFTPTLRVCAALDIPSWSAVTWFMAMAFDLVIWVMSAREAVRYLRESQELTAQASSRYLTFTNWSKQGTLFRVLLRDSITFPFISVVIAFSNILSWLVKPLFPAIIYTTTASSVCLNLIGCRLILNLRDAYYQPFADEFSHSLQGVDDDPAVVELVNFAHPNDTDDRRSSDSEPAPRIPSLPLSQSRLSRQTFVFDQEESR